MVPVQASATRNETEATLAALGQLALLLVQGSMDHVSNIL